MLLITSYFYKFSMLSFISIIIYMFDCCLIEVIHIVFLVYADVN